MQISKKTFIGSVLGLFWGVILVSMLFGGWQAKTTEAQAVIKTSDDIKGWMKVEQIAKDLKITTPQLAEVIGYKGKLDPEKAFKDLTNDDEEKMDAYKDKIDDYLKKNKSASIAEEKGGEGERVKVTTGNNLVDTKDIRGYMTFQEVADKYKIPVKEIFKELKIPSYQDPKVQMKELTSTYNFEVQDVRDFVGKYK